MMFKPNDRVTVDPDPRTKWSDPRVDRLVKQGRPATVTAVQGTKLPAKERTYSVEFDVVRKGATTVKAFGVPVSYLRALT